MLHPIPVGRNAERCTGLGVNERNRTRVGPRDGFGKSLPRPPSSVTVTRLQLLALIPESTRKAKGGDPPAPQAASVLADLPRETRMRLEALRGEMASAASEAVSDDGAYLPAYLRFQGNMYRHIPPEAWEQRSEGVEVLIVSALYGLLASREPAVRYDCSMAEPLGSLGKLNRWWRDHGLPEILAAYVTRVGPRQVVDLLSLEYREAVSGYAARLGGIPVKTINFPGLGRGSQPRRGRIVTEVLGTGRIPTPSEDS